MIRLQIDSLSQLKDNQGFWDNFIWPLTLAIVIGLFVLIKKYAFKTKEEKANKTIINFYVDEHGELHISNDKALNSKLGLIKQLIRNSQLQNFSIKIKPKYKIYKLNKFERKELQLKLDKKEKELKDKFEILLLRPFDHSLEHSTVMIRKTIEGLILRRSPNVTGKIKLEIYRNHDPKIYFPIYLTQEQFTKLSKNQNITGDSLKKQLRIPTMTSVSVFDSELIYSKVIPGLVNEIYRLKTMHDFDITTEHWDVIMGYEVGLG